jgi:hypothetical protein
VTKSLISALSFKKYFEKLLDVNHTCLNISLISLEHGRNSKSGTNRMRNRSLISPEEAAGYAMAPSVEDMVEQDRDDMVLRQPEVAFRNGHAAAARGGPRQFFSLEQILSYIRAHADPGRVQWFREHIPGRWSGRAHA